MELYFSKTATIHYVGEPVTVRVSNGVETVTLEGGVITKLASDHVWVNGIRFRYSDIVKN